MPVLELPEDMDISATAAWYGGNRTRAQEVGKQMGRLAWAGVVFAGGMPELPWIDATSGVANDLHRHVINLARVVKDEALCDRLVDRLGDVLVHPDELEAAQARCMAHEVDYGPGGLFGGGGKVMSETPDLEWALAYFVACWMTRGGLAGQADEFRTSLATRFSPGGGGSGKRFRSAASSLKSWSKALGRWEFTRLDALKFLENGYDLPDVGYYADPPWFDDGARYRHPFSLEQHAMLARKLGTFEKARVVVRLNVHHQTARLYPEGKPWVWQRQETTNQAGGAVQEVLIMNGPAY